jgi:organic hydroperoxide reductase OsmC/OhrA
VSEHKATIRWKLESADFEYANYNRDHTWDFEGGQTVAASAAPGFQGSEDRVDPEEAFVASLSSCHMLTFLAICAKKRRTVTRYEDQAVGFLEKNADGQLAMTRVTLKPVIEFAGTPPTAEELAALHAASHRNCFIANSVKTEVAIG